jgi:hypothetical protein
MGLKTTIDLSVQAAHGFTLDQGSSNLFHKVAEALSWPSGTAASQADEVWSDSRTVNSGANDDLEMDNLSQVDSSGAAVRSVSFAVVKLVFIRNVSTSGSLEVGAPGATAFAGTGYPFKDDSDIACVPFGGGWLWYDPTGVAVTNGATDVLRVSGVTANQTYQILVIGEAA